MKKYLLCVLQFVFLIIIAEVVIFLLTVSEIASGTSYTSRELLSALALGLPLSLIVSLFITFFSMTRLFAHKISGYIFALLCVFGVFSAFYFIVRLLPEYTQGDIQRLCKPIFAAIPAYGQCLSVLYEATRLPLHGALVNISYTALYFTSFWGLTRITRARHLAGALVMPVILVLSVFMYGFIHSSLLMQFIASLKLPFPSFAVRIGAVIVVILTALGFDLLFSYPPLARRQTS